MLQVGEQEQESSTFAKIVLVIVPILIVLLNVHMLMLYPPWLPCCRVFKAGKTHVLINILERDSRDYHGTIPGWENLA